MKPRLHKSFQTEIYNLFAWLNHHKDSGITLEGSDNETGEVCLTNKKANFMYNFNLNNLRELRGVNKLMCLWANDRVSTNRDFDGKLIFDMDDFNEINSG